jgi:hypothetical protein
MTACSRLLSTLITIYATIGLLITVATVVGRLKAHGGRLKDVQLQGIIPTTPRLRMLLAWYQRIGWLVIVACLALLICSGGL